MSLSPPFQQPTNTPQKIYGIWGDENGDDGDKPMVGEASISLATACFGTSMTGDNGHDDTDVLYIAFPGTDAVPGASGANWGATSWSAFETSIEALGNKLIARIGGGTPSSSSSSTTTSKPTTTKTTTSAATTSTVTCAWAGHCLGATCTTNDDCSDPWACISGKCALDPATNPTTTTTTKKTTTTTTTLKTSTTLKTTTTKTTSSTGTTTSCAWAGHCLGASCSTNDDCSDPWACISGKCAVDPSVTPPSTTPSYTCNWAGHCEGASCTSDGLCADQLGCDTTDKVCTMDGCAWAGHCLGAVCKSDDDCSDPYECNTGVGYCWYAT